MGIKYLWDTNTAIYYLQKLFPYTAEVFMDTILLEFQPAIPVITEIELLCWKTAQEKDILVLNGFTSDAYVFELEQRIKLKTIELRKTHSIKLPDAIIAATSLVYGLTLLTRNERDFKNITGLQLVNPWNA
jgi:predicted nucleic acid-binding protein